jgi:TIR domain
MFISNCNADLSYRERLLIHLRPLEREGILDIWDETRLVPGAVWQVELENALRAAQVALLLVSADYLAADFLRDQQLPMLLTGAEQRGTIIVPLIAGWCAFQRSPLSRFRPANPYKPLSAMTRDQREELFATLAEQIVQAINRSV